MDLSKERLPKTYYEKNLMFDLIEDDQDYIEHVSLDAMLNR